MKEDKISLIAECGINHNGSVELAKQIIDASKLSGFDYVKFQKRTPEICVPDSQKQKIRETPWGSMTYIEYKERIEFGKEEYDQIDEYCKKVGIKWFASVWDKVSVDFMADYCDIAKIPSALINDLELCAYARKKFETLIISTGMSTEEEIEACVNACSPDVVMHTNSTYPTPVEEANIMYIKWLQEKYPDRSIGYSGHEYGLTVSFATVALGVEWLERHVTIDRTMWGSDQLASLEPIGMIKLCKGIRDIEKSMKGYAPRVLFTSEKVKMQSLRK